MSDPHIGFIVAAYAVATLTIGAMIGWVVLDFRRLNAQLDRAARALDGCAGRRAPMSVEAEATGSRPGAAGWSMRRLSSFWRSRGCCSSGSAPAIRRAFPRS